MNLPNQLTVSRFVLTAFFLVAVFWWFPFNDTVALVLFGIASFTDLLDGRIARQRKLITNFGILMDPLADKILTCSAFIALVERGRMEALTEVQVHAWMVVIIVARELGITGLRMLAASKNVVLAAEGYGKHKTISQMVAIAALLLVEACKEWGSFGHDYFHPWLPLVAKLALWLTVFLTLLSGTLYLWKNRQIYLRDT